MSVDLVRIVDSIHREKNISKEILFEGIESALATAAKKHYPDAEEIVVSIDPESGDIDAVKDGAKMDPSEFGRIAAQTAKQVIIQKIREAERDSLFDEFEDQRGDLITGTVQRFEGGAVTVNLGKTEAPPAPQRADPRREPPRRRTRPAPSSSTSARSASGSRSSCQPDPPRLRPPPLRARDPRDRRPDHRDPGPRPRGGLPLQGGRHLASTRRSTAVGACVGVRGTRIKNIVDELGGERIDIVRWNESLQVLIPNALQPAEIDEVMLCQLLGRAIVLVSEDQLSLAIGRRGQNVRLASKLVGWDIEIMTSRGARRAASRRPSPPSPRSRGSTPTWPRSWSSRGSSASTTSR